MPSLAGAASAALPRHRRRLGRAPAPGFRRSARAAPGRLKGRPCHAADTPPARSGPWRRAFRDGTAESCLGAETAPGASPAGFAPGWRACCCTDATLSARFPGTHGQVLDGQGKRKTGTPHARSLPTLIRLSANEGSAIMSGSSLRIVVPALLVIVGSVPANLPPAHAADGTIVVQRQVQPRVAYRPSMVPDPHPTVVDTNVSAEVNALANGGQRQYREPRTGRCRLRHRYQRFRDSQHDSPRWRPAGFRQPAGEPGDGPGRRQPRHHPRRGRRRRRRPRRADQRQPQAGPGAAADARGGQ